MTYLTRPDAAHYRLVLDVLLEEEGRLGLHLTTAEIGQRVARRLEESPRRAEEPPVDRLLASLYEWGNVDRIQNRHRKGTYQEYLKKDYLYQLTPAGAQVHRALTAIDQELGAAGALQSSMLPEVLRALDELHKLLQNRASKRDVYSTVQRIFNGFVQLSENAKRFVQGLNHALEPGSDIEDEVFLVYKDDVILYLRTFVMALLRYASPITQAIDAAESAGVVALFPGLALFEATPTLGMSLSEVADRDAVQLESQWRGLRGWFFGDHDRPPVTQTLQDRSAEAVNLIVATVRRRNNQRFRKVNRAADMMTLATWFAGTRDAGARAAIWRSAFGMYSARHFGAAHPPASDLDLRSKTSWWEGPAAPIEPRLRKQGPRSTTGRPNGVRDPRAAKLELARLQAQEQAATDAAIRLLTARTPARVSALPVLSETELDVFLSCLNVVLSASPDTTGRRTGRTGDGRLRVVLRPAPENAYAPHRAVVRTARGVLVLEDFELTVLDLHRGGE
ncbi:TIGR02677 family protein [Amycolatopsis camponoti]|uniref:TIGR02677 family protein n=1 Tax=Amycolatopsis camponoti TaxID=2606593 RepID=UPI0018C25E44|nr:TIGR02677 family protein [Amycolatopsis camponoti]